MKTRILFLLVLVCLIGKSSNAQTQMLDIGDREPTFYYWDTNWFDHYVLNVAADTIIFTVAGTPTRSFSGEYARYCYTDTALRVIGMAAAIGWSNTNSTATATMIEQVMDYFRLYEVDSTTDDMILKASAPFDINGELYSRYQIRINYDPFYPNDYPYWKPLYEVYFDKPVIVHDSFYIAFTDFNNHPTGAYNRTTTQKFCYACRANDPDLAYSGDPVCDLFGPQPPIWKLKRHDLNSNETYHDIYDTNWHTISTIYTHSIDTIYTHTFNEWWFMFPIIDTSFRGAPMCRSPRELRVDSISSEAVIFSWDEANTTNYNPSDHWEISIYNPNSMAEFGTTYLSDTTSLTVTGLDTARWYKASIRSFCSRGDNSSWDRGILFYVPGTSQLQVESAVDQNTSLTPNPTNNQVTVSSPFQINTIDIYTLEGKKIASAAVNSTSTSLDMTQYPAGTYMLRIITSNGMTTKKLVVE